MTTGYLLEQKVSAIKDAIATKVNTVCPEPFSILQYGAYDIHPRHLVYWICVQTDTVKQQLSTNRELFNELRGLLIIHDYPEDARQSVHIGVESQQTVDRESAGNWYNHFK